MLSRPPADGVVDGSAAAEEPLQSTDVLDKCPFSAGDIPVERPGLNATVDEGDARGGSACIREYPAASPCGRL